MSPRVHEYVFPPLKEQPLRAGLRSTAKGPHGAISGNPVSDRQAYAPGRKPTFPGSETPPPVGSVAKIQATVKISVVPINRGRSTGVPSMFIGPWRWPMKFDIGNRQENSGQRPELAPLLKKPSIKSVQATIRQRPAPTCVEVTASSCQGRPPAAPA